MEAAVGHYKVNWQQLPPRPAGLPAGAREWRSTYPRTAKPQAAAACGLAPNRDLERFRDKLQSKLWLSVVADVTKGLSANKLPSFTD